MSGKRGGRSARSNLASDEESSPIHRLESKRNKREAKTGQEPMETEDFEPGSWACTVCTFRNRYEAFKCEICESRKGTSTRKPRLNQSVVQQQTLAQNLATQQFPVPTSGRKPRLLDGRSRFSPESSGSGQNSRGVASSRSSPVPGKVTKRRNVRRGVERPVIPFSDDLIKRNKFERKEITVDNSTFVIYEYKVREKSKRKREKRVKRPKKEEKDLDEGNRSS